MRILLFNLLLLLFINSFSQASNVEIQQSPNLLSNPNFMARDPQQRPLFWITGMSLQTATITREQKHSLQPDDLSLKLSDSSGTADLLVRSEKHIVNPGTKYFARGWVKNKKGTSARFLLEFWDQNNKRVDFVEASPNVDTAWKEYFISKEAPDKATHVTVAFLSDKETTGISYWDDISLQYEFAYEKNISEGMRELFLDDYRIASMHEVERLAHAAERTRPLIKPTEPWEGNAAYIYGTVLKNEPAGSGYRMWYTGYSNQEYYLCYATSIDGIKWNKPTLGLIDFKGSKKNNICRVGGGTLVYDPDDKDSSRRYKLMSVSRVDNGKRFGYGVWFSPDGLKWTAYEGNPVISYADVSNVTYDQPKKLFIASTKQRMLVSNTSVTPNKMDRAAFISVSKDFIHWSAPGAPASQWTLAVEGDIIDDMIVMAKGGLEEQIYGMTVHPYQGIYIGLPWCFDLMNYNNGIYAGYGDGPIQPQIASSRDLRHWSRLAREPVLPLGKAGAWDDGTIYTASTMQVSEKKIDLYYGAMNLAHGGDKGSQKQIAQIARASWRRDGFVSLHNEGNDVGIITTKPFVFTGKKLMVNAKLFSQGNLKVELLDASGKPIPGYTVADARIVTGDQLSAIAGWGNGNDISNLEGKEVQLRFYLKGGDLYSYWFTR
jgi:hypothetical protein